jgi:hypothetical protein
MRLCPSCNGLQTVAHGLANRGCFRLTFRANKRRLGLTLAANKPILRLLATFGEVGSMSTSMWDIEKFPPQE